MARANSRKSSTALASLAVLGAITLTMLGGAAIALAMTGTAVMALSNSIRITPAIEYVDARGDRSVPAPTASSARAATTRNAS
jgi:hypothetical protein